MRRINLAVVVFALAGLVAFVSCAQKDNGGTEALTPDYMGGPQPCNVYGAQGMYPNTACPYGAAGTPYPYSYPQGYNYQWNYGAWQWPTQVNMAVNNCGCPAGYYPVYGVTYGMACAPTGYYGSGSYGGAYGGVPYGGAGYAYGAPVMWGSVGFYPGPSVNYQWTTIPQVTYNQPIDNACWGSAAVGCDTRYSGTCPAGRQCVPAAGAATIGICR